MDFQDYLSIKNIIHRYPQCADKGDFDAVGQLHADTVVSLMGREPHFKAQGAQAFTDYYVDNVRRFPGRDHRGRGIQGHHLGEVLR